jgi:sulfate adenylyltransferase (ADP) / ATP adenylyltransferase
MQVNDVQFLVRILAGAPGESAVHEKQRTATVAGAATRNPFLPYEPEMFVADVSATHLCLLNKFTVIDNHLLIVTRAFEEQEAPLTVADFAALWVCMAECDGLGFYNAGRMAGASQRHKHLQLVPLPLGTDGRRLPIEPLLRPGPAGADLCPALPFAHVFLPTGVDHRMPLEAAAVKLHAAYVQMLKRTNLAQQDTAGLFGPYNLLLTDTWMLLVPRSNESASSIAVNALGYAGCMLVRDEAQLRTLETIGPLKILAETGRRANNSDE